MFNLIRVSVLIVALGFVSVGCIGCNNDDDKFKPKVEPNIPVVEDAANSRVPTKGGDDEQAIKDLLGK